MYVMNSTYLPIREPTRPLTPVLISKRLVSKPTTLLQWMDCLVALFLSEV